MTKKFETKVFGGKITEVKELNRNGVNIGTISGYIATWDVDRGLDKFMKGCFAESLTDFRKTGRQIRFKDHHGRTIGGFPIEYVREDDTGLFGIAEVNLDVQQGKEAYSLAKQGVLTEFSIGFEPVEFKYEGQLRVISMSRVWEGSIVDEPMNPQARIVEVKGASQFQDLPLAPRDREWDSTAAIARLREFTGSQDAPTTDYRRGFLWYDESASDLFGSYKLPFADVVDDRLVAVPRGIIAAAGAMLGARGGVDIPEADRPAVVRHIERYYAKMDMPSPFTEKRYFVAEDIKAMSVREMEEAIRSSGSFSREAATMLASRFGGEKKYTLEEAEILLALRDMKKSLT